MHQRPRLVFSVITYYHIQLQGGPIQPMGNAWVPIMMRASIRGTQVDAV